MFRYRCNRQLDVNTYFMLRYRLEIKILLSETIPPIHLRQYTHEDTDLKT